MPSRASSYANLFPLEGGCACGYVRYRVNRAPLVIHCCHCTACQRETGGPFAINAIIEAEHVELLPSADASVPWNKTALEIAQGGPPLEIKSPFVAGASSTVCIATPTESKNPQLIYRCRVCATALWSCYGPSAPRDFVRYIRASTLDRAREVAPDAHIFVASKRDFIALTDGKPQFQALYQAIDVYRPESQARLNALMIKIKREMQA
ncbi:glutathione-dependent formaldehyde-activating [Plectosphaerella plurivora]|uniref:Glutathione-dependent formaldehyde-activating n=1 Tax=Plectosphaerella plurivora TaxID=936078 RepID=A0A9P8V7C2_9PEZI|nr:glutathione-dependent formaldehyde-activating [Plectosphaerella plurivora]